MIDMDGFEIRDSRFAHYILANAFLEELATGFRWTEGLVWMGDADCLLFQDLLRDRTMRWIENAGVAVYREPSGYASGQTRDRQGRLVSCSHRERCLLRTEPGGTVTRLVDRHDGRRLNAPNDVGLSPTARSGLPTRCTEFRRTMKTAVSSPNSRRPCIASIPTAAKSPSLPQTSMAPMVLRFPRTRAGSMWPRLAIRQPTTRSNTFGCSNVDPAGKLSTGDIFHKMEPGYADGVCVDEDGNLWSNCIDPNGRLLGARCTRSI